MPGVQDLRRWLKGEDVDGLPERDEVWVQEAGIKSNPYNLPAKICSRCQGTGVWSGDPCTSCEGNGWIPKSSGLVDKLREKQTQGGRGYGKYKISADGKDAILLFGKHNGYAVSDLAKTDDGRSYLKWMLAQEFDSALKDVCSYQLRHTK